MCIVVCVTADGCILAKIDDLSYSPCSEMLEGEVRPEGVQGGTIISGRVATRSGTDLQYGRDNVFRLQRSTKGVAERQQAAAQRKVVL